ncbi:MAG TPA: elongation factor G [Nitrospiraceae bacterium]|nr:elongation factor G [Nitrospiraceae bacterium]
MRSSSMESIRNVAVVSHAGSGKTSLVEAMLYAAGGVQQLGSVLNGTSVCDFEPEEIHRHTSLNTSVARLTYKDTVVNLVDTPGALSFSGETMAALRAVDGVILVLSAASGMRSELSRLWSAVREAGLACMVYVNELDKDGASLLSLVDAFQSEFETVAVPLCVPIGTGTSLTGIVDLIAERARLSGPESAKVKDDGIPADLSPLVEQTRKRLIEAVAEVDDRYLERYLTDGTLSSDDLLQGLRAGVRQGKLVPVCCGSAIRTIGTQALLEACVGLLPSPAERGSLQGVPAPGSSDPIVRQADPSAPFSGFVFKTIIDPFAGRLSYLRVFSGVLAADTPVYNATRQVKEKGGHLFTILGKKYTPVPSASAGDIVAIAKLKDTMTGDTLCDEQAPIQYPPLRLARPVLSFAIEAKSKSEIEKVSLGLHKLIEEDPSLEFSRNAETKEMVLSGMGQLHLDVALEKLHRKYGADVIVHTPKVPYKETIRSTAQAQGKYKKQTGGHGQYGDCWLEVSPLARGAGFEFVNRIVGGAIPRNFIPAVEKGVVEAMQEGILAGFPVVDVRVTVYDGSYHVVDSSELAFKVAGSMGFKKAMEAAHPVLLEPIMTVEIEAPEDVIGAVIGDLNSRRGRIVTVSAKGHTEIITATVPLAELLKYAPVLTSITGGRGNYVMDFSHYEEVPRDHAARIIEEQKAARQPVAAH